MDILSILFNVWWDRENFHGFCFFASRLWKRVFYLVQVFWRLYDDTWTGSSHKRQKAQAPTPRAPIRNRQTIKVANAKVLNRNTNLT